MQEAPPALPPKLYKIRQKEAKNEPCLTVNNGIPTVHALGINAPRINSFINRKDTKLKADNLDLKGKSRDDLVLLLLQLNREKSNLTQWKRYFRNQIDNLTPIARTDPKATQELDALYLELKDVEEQLKSSLPLIMFIDNTIRMWDVISSDASRASLHLSSTSSKRCSVEFVRLVEEKEVAKSLEKEISQSMSELTGKDTGLGKKHGSGEHDYPEDPIFRGRRIQLEEELRKLDEIWKNASVNKTEFDSTPAVPTSRRQMSSATKRATQGRKSSIDLNRSKSDIDLEKLACLPRRSVKQHSQSVLMSSDHKRNVSSQNDFSFNSASVSAANHQNRRKYSIQEKSPATPTSLFLMEPITPMHSRWKFSGGAAAEINRNSLESPQCVESQPSSSYPPPIPAKPTSRRKTVTQSTGPQLPLRMSRWKSFSENLTTADSQLNSFPAKRNNLLESVEYPRKFSTNSQNPSSMSKEKPPVFHKVGSSCANPYVPSEDPYEETPRFDSNYETTSTPCSYVDVSHLLPPLIKRRSRIANIPPEDNAQLNAAVEYVPGESIYETSDTTTFNHRRPPDLSDVPIKSIGLHEGLCLPYPVYPTVIHKIGSTQSPMTLPTSISSAFHTPVELIRSRSSIV